MTVTQVALNSGYLVNMSSSYGSLGRVVWLQMSALWITKVK